MRARFAPNSASENPDYAELHQKHLLRSKLETILRTEGNTKANDARAKKKEVYSEGGDKK